MKFSLGYLTAPTKKDAKEIVLELLARRLIACANILPVADAYYVWEDELHQDSEAVIFLKTHSKNEGEIIAVVKKMHPYECPCIVFTPLDNGNPDYLKWVGKSC